MQTDLGIVWMIRIKISLQNLTTLNCCLQEFFLWNRSEQHVYNPNLVPATTFIELPREPILPPPPSPGIDQLDPELIIFDEQKQEFKVSETARGTVVPRPIAPPPGVRSPGTMSPGVRSPGVRSPGTMTPSGLMSPPDIISPPTETYKPLKSLGWYCW